MITFDFATVGFPSSLFGLRSKTKGHTDFHLTLTLFLLKVEKQKKNALFFKEIYLQFVVFNAFKYWMHSRSSNLVQNKAWCSNFDIIPFRKLMHSPLK